MSRFDYLADQGYQDMATEVYLPPSRLRRQRTKVAGTMAKVGYWVGFIVGCVGGVAAGMKGHTAVLPGILVGAAGAAVLGLVGLAIDGAASLGD
jgi:hypothetical protein